MIAKINQTVLLGLVNGTAVTLSMSTGSVPYMVVRENASGTKPIGLLYLTTDVALNATYGFAGPIGVLVYINTTGTIRSLEIWTMYDLEGYYIAGPHVLQNYLNSFVNRSVFEPLQVGNDIQGITGATYTSKGIAGGVRVAGRMVVDDFQRVDPAVSNDSLLSSALAVFARISPDSALPLLALLSLFLASVAAYRTANKRIKYAVFGGSLLFLGIYVGRMVSISDLPIFITGYFPPLAVSPFWYLLYGGVLITSVLWGRLYCGYLCPFGAFTEILNTLSPLKRVMPRAIHARLVYLKYFVLVATVIVSYLAIQGVVDAHSFFDVEPFSALFLLVGDALAFVFLGAMLFAAVFFNRFYCSYLCPAGAALSLAGCLRIQEIRRWPECSACRVCENDCPTGAISGGKISTFECMDCRECEENYLDANTCPHYKSERIGRAA